MPKTPTRTLIEDRLGRPLIEIIREQRPLTSWRLIALNVRDATGIDVTGETLRGWFERERRAA